MNRLLILGIALIGPAIGSIRGQPLPTGLPVGRFLTDSIEIGRPFQYAFTYYHAPGVDVLFPDTAINFRPFRVTQVAITPTHTTETLSRDSAVYTLVSFDVDPLQTLKLPVRLINAMDCTAIESQPDTVFLKSRIRPKLGEPQPMTLAADTQLAPLRQQFDYPRLLLVVGILFLGAALIVLFFGRTLRQQWRLYQLSRRHNRFLNEHDRLASSLTAETVSDTTNQVTIGWKAYMERLSGQVYAALTTSEIADLTGDDRAADALRTTDRMIYGGEFSGQSDAALRVLRDLAEQMYVQRRRQILQSGISTDEPVIDELH